MAQLLELARLDPQRLAAQGTVCDAVAVARDTLAGLFPVAEQYRQTLALTLSGAVPVAMPADALQMVLRNLIDNACRYSPPGSLVQVSGEARDGRLLIAVADGGAGLTPA
ncbi:two-component sensor histidine kinase, partial [Vibrio agarivorans]